TDGQSQYCKVSSKIPVLVEEGDEFRYWRKAWVGYSIGQVFIQPVGGEQIVVEDFFHGHGSTWDQTIIDLSDYVGQYITVGVKLEGAIGTSEFIKIDDIYPASWFAHITETTGITDTTYSFTNQPPDEYFYQVKAIANDGEESGWSNIESIDLNTVTGIEGEIVIVYDWSLSQNYPNPFNPTTTISYQLKETADVKLVVYNILGQEVRTLVNQHKQAGAYQVVWDGRNNIGQPVGSGIFIYKIVANSYGETDDFTKINKMILLR
ncbi:MAG: T9SS type A sorting domain-containing protein, partial [Calditrichia bacterium]|nr:T9SS type A sorting domain-containing protein [Calditrichia bacterium]